MGFVVIMMRAQTLSVDDALKVQICRMGFIRELQTLIQSEASDALLLCEIAATLSNLAVFKETHQYVRNRVPI